MAYVTLVDVKAAAPQIEFSGFTRPTEDDVNRWIAEVEGGLNAQLVNLGYVLPFNTTDNPLSIAILRDMVVHAVIARVLTARLWGVSDNVDGSGWKTAQAYYDQRLTWLIDPTHPFELPDASQTILAPGKPRGWRFGNFNEDTDFTDEDGPRVTMRQEF